MHTISVTRPIGTIPPKNLPMVFGMNLPRENDFGRTEIFTNIMYQSRGFAFPSDPFMNSLGIVPLDANGYPNQDFGWCIGRTTPSVGTQDFNFGCTGDAGTVTFNGNTGWIWASGPTYNSGTNRTTGVLRAPSGDHGQPALIFTNTRKTNASAVNTGIADFELVRPGFSADLTAPRINPGYVTFLQSLGISYIRSMDWQQTNGNVTTTPFSSENSVTNFRMTRQGAYPLQFATDLAILGGWGVWLTIKVNADDQYVADLATWLQANVPASTEVNVETVSNEPWNSSFQQYFEILNKVCIEVDGWHGFNTNNWLNRHIVSISRTSNVTTVTVNGTLSANYFAGAAVYTLSISTGGTVVNGVNTILGVTSNSFTFTDTGANNANMLTGGSSVVSLTNTDLNVYDGAFDMLGQLHQRWIARRACQVSNIFRSTLISSGALLNTRYNMLLVGLQTVNDGTQHFGYIDNRLPHPANYYLRAVGNGGYPDLNASALGGADLRNVNTFNGNTPPAISDYLDTWTRTVNNSKLLYVYDKLSVNAKLHGLEVWQYEVGYNSNSTTGVTGATTAQKLASLYDAGMESITQTFLNDKLYHGYDRVTWYWAGYMDPNTQSENESWHIVTQADNTSSLGPSSRMKAFNDVLSVPHPGLKRNFVSAVGATVLDARGTVGRYPTDWPANTTYTGLVTDWLDPIGRAASVDPAYLVCGDDGQIRTIIINTTAIGAGRSFFFFWNGAQVGGLISPTNGQTQDWTFTIYLQRGNNVLQLPRNGFVGSNLQVNTFTFPAVL